MLLSLLVLLERRRVLLFGSGRESFGPIFGGFD